MRTEHVQGWTPEAWFEYRVTEWGEEVPPERRERPRPVHAVVAVIEEDGDADLALEDRTVCGRIETGRLEPALPLTPFGNSPHEDRCTWCEQRLLAERAGQPTDIPRFQ